MTAGVPDALTLTEAVRLMDPSMPLRTLQARVKAAENAGDIAHVSTRLAGPAGGRPAKEYRASDLFAVHRDWVFNTQGKRATNPAIRKKPGRGMGPTELL